MTDLIPSDISKFITDYQSAKDVELEVSFQKLDEQTWSNVNAALIEIVNKKNISASDSLDVSIDLGDERMLRYLLTDPQDIDKLTALKTSQVHPHLLALKASDNIHIDIKDRGSGKWLQMPEINARLKLVKEAPTKTRQFGSERLLFRYKNRYSFTHGNLRFDTTRVRQSNRLETLGSVWPHYEVEIEVINKKITVKELTDAIISVVKAIQNTDLIIGRSEATAVLDYYHDTLATGNILSRNVISLETQHVKHLPNKYAATDKADGVRHILIIKGDEPYLITTNGVVKKTDVKLKSKAYDKTIIDGEYLDDLNAYLAFDLVYANGISYVHDTSYTLTHRITKLNEIIDKAFGNLIPFKEYTGDYDLPAILKHYETEYVKYWKAFKTSNKIFITRKVYLTPFGISEAEIFAYGDLIWRLATKQTIWPYKLDGIIYTPINQPYYIQTKGIDLDKALLDYKWKPHTLNSIDFYIVYDKDDTGEDAIYVIDGTEYKVANLYVGRDRNREETPVPFSVNGEEQVAKLKVINGETRDADGEALPDKSVVEFTFDAITPGIDNSFRWIAHKYRADKTESVQRYRTKYGNNVAIAARIWRSIQNPVTEQMIAALADPKTFAIELDRLSKPQSYYHKASASAIGMRAFHSWIKSNLISLYANGNVLDIGCGRGGDLQKFIRAKVKSYVGVDIDYNSMYVIPDSAVARYNKLKRIAPPMHFVQADAKLPFDVDIQSRALPTMTSTNKSMINEYLKNKYDTISAQFTLHYYLQDDESWSNFCNNLNQTMSEGSYLLITTFDGKLIYDKLKTKNKITITYDDSYGNRFVLCEITKAYDSPTSKRTGLGIDVHNGLINAQGQTIKEYLVDPDFLKESLADKCGLIQVETASFYDVYQLYEGSFRGDNRQIRDVQSFYRLLKENDQETLASFKMSMLNRYYVFKKPGVGKKPARIVGFNRCMNRLLAPHFAKMALQLDDRLSSKNINDTYRDIRSIYQPARPTVYLVKHSVKDDLNSMSFKCVKEADPAACIVYRDPSGTFYPLRYKNTHLIDSKKAIKDLSDLVKISNAFN